MIKKIKVSDNDVIFDNIVIGKYVNEGGIENILKKEPSRIVRNINTILIYDDEGLYFYTSKKGESEISQIDIQMEIQHWLAFAPHSKYNGKFYIRDKEIQSLDDLLGLGDDILNTDELDGDGNIKIYLNRISLDININSETRALQNISIWYL